LLKTILPAACLWTGLRAVEGFDCNATLKELINLYPADGDVAMDEDDEGSLPHSVPESIREMASSKDAIKALGSMIWYQDHLCTLGC
jgi:DNA mismatch repair protein MSH6